MAAARRAAVLSALVLVAHAWLCTATLEESLTLHEPQFWSVEPSRGSLAGGTRVTIHGSGFSNASTTGLANTVFIGDTECEVVQLHSTPNQIVCKTKAPALYRDEWYRVRVFVDGGRPARCAQEVPSVNCNFRFENGRTSDLRSVSPMVLHEPTVVKLNGYHRFAHLEESDFSTPTREVVKVTVKIVNQGDQVGLPGDSAIGGNGDFCQLFDDATDEPYGYKPNSASGWLKCRMDTTERAAGLYNFTIIQSEAYGESLVKSSAFLYDVDGTPFTVAVAPKVHSVYPPVGSAAGGTVITIRGHSFSSDASAVDVKVGGVPCEVLKASPKFIQCRIGDRASSASLDQWQPGTRGVDMRFFDGAPMPGAHPTSGLNMWRHDLQQEYFATPLNIRSNYFTQQRAFFRVPATGAYQLLISGDDHTTLYAALDGNMSHVQEVAKTHGASGHFDFNRWSSQRSKVLHLTEGQLVALYVEHREGGGWDHSAVGLLYQNSSYSSIAMTGGGIVAPQQAIHLRWAYNDERQRVHVGPSTGSARDVGGTFTLALGERDTAPIPYNASARAVWQALVDTTGSTCTYPTDNSTGQRIFDLDQFEHSLEWGPRNHGRPFRAIGRGYCGRFGMGLRDTYARNWEWENNREANQSAPSYQVTQYPYMCAAFNIPRGVHVNLLVHISGIGWRSVSVTQPDEGPLHYPKVGDFGFMESALDDGQWHYRCTNLLESMRAAMPTRSTFTVTAVIFHNNGRTGHREVGTFYMDEFAIAAKPRDVVRTPYSLPRDTDIKDLKVTKEWSDESGATYDIRMQTYDCADGLSALGIDGSGLTGAAAVAVDRYQPHSPRQDGTMSVTVEGQTVSFPATANNADIMAAFREQSTLEHVTATQHRVCESGESLVVVRLNDHAGSINTYFPYDVSGLSQKVTYKAQWFHGLGRGGAFNKRLPAAWLQTAVQRDRAQVSVFVNGQSAVCASNATCEFDFRLDATPALSSLSVVEASAGSSRRLASTAPVAATLTIAGTGFGTDVDAVTVTVGGAACEVTAVTDTQVTCDASEYTAGKNKVKVYIDGVGKADGDLVAVLPLILDSVEPTQAYVPVQTIVKIVGAGFSDTPLDNVVTIGDQACTVVASDSNELVCITEGVGSALSAQDVVVKVKGPVMVLNVTNHGNYTTNSSIPAVGVIAEDALPGVFDLKSYSPPTASQVTPAAGSAAGGTAIVVKGTHLDRPALRVFLGASECEVTSRAPSQLECTTGVAAPGNYSLALVEAGLDTVATSVFYTFRLALTAVAAGPTSGSYRGGVSVQLAGEGFTTGAGGARITPLLRTTVPDVQVVGLYGARPQLDVQRVTITAELRAEVQAVRLEGATSGAFTLSLGGATTAPVAFDANEFIVAAAVRAALPGAGVARTTVSASAAGARTWSVTFRGGAGDMDLMTVDTSGLNAGAGAAVTEEVAGRSLAGTFRLRLAESTSPVALAWDADAAAVQAAILAMNGTGAAVEVSPRETILGGTAVGSAWVVTFATPRPEGTRGRMTIDAAALEGTSVAGVVDVESVGTQAITGTFALTVGGEVTAPLPYDASAAAVQAAVSALSSVAGVVVRRVDDQPGKKFGSWYPHQWLLSLLLTDAPQANGTVACTNPEFIDWRPDACPSHAADVYLSRHVAEFPTRMNRPSDYGTPAHIASVQALCDAEARSLGMVVGGCQARIVPQTRPYCAGPLGASAPPCWVQRWNTTMVEHLDGRRVTYLQRNIEVSSDTQKGYRFWQPLAQVQALEAAFTQVDVSGLAGSGVGLDVTRRRPGGYIEHELTVTAATDTSMTVTIPPAHVAAVASYSLDLADLGMAVALAHYSMEGAHGQTGIVVNAGSMGTPADGQAHNLVVAASEDEAPRGFSAVFAGAAARMRGDAFASITTPPSKALAPVGDFTVEGWFMPASSSSSSSASSASSGLDTLLAGIFDAPRAAGYGLFLSADGKWEAWVGVGPSSASAPPSSSFAAQLRLSRGDFMVAQSSLGAAQEDVWTHLAATFDAATATLTLFVNGVEAGSATPPAVGVLPAPVTSPRPFVLGGGCAVAGPDACGHGGACQTHPVCTATGQGALLPGSTLAPFDGYMDEVAVYDVRVSPAELARHANFAALTAATLEFAVGVDTTVRVGCAPSPGDCAFTYSEPATPAITRVVPDAPLPGDALTVVGAHLDAAGLTATFNGADWGCSVASASRLTCTVPADTPAGVVAIAAAADSGAAAVSYEAARLTVMPRVAAVVGNETSLLGGTTLTLEGTGFGTDAAAVEVGISWWTCAVTAVSQTRLSCTIPRIPVVEFPAFVSAHTALVHPVSVVVNGLHATGCHGGDACRVAYLASATPSIEALTLAEDGVTSVVSDAVVVDAGTVVTVSGTGFSAATPTDNVLTLTAGTEAVPCTLTSAAVAAATATRFNCTLGGAGGLVVGGPLQATFAVDGRVGLVLGAPSATVTVAPVVTSVSPAVGSQAGGSTLVITGRGFSAHTANVVVRVAGTPCAVATATATRITCLTPPAPLPAFSAAYRRRLRAAAGVATLRGLADDATGADVASLTSTVAVAVRGVGAVEGAACADCLAFVYNASHTPVITAVAQSGGGGGAVITVSGSGFSATASDNTVVVGGAACAVDVDTAAEDSLTCTMPSPPSVAGSYGVRVTVAGKGLAALHVNASHGDVTVGVAPTVTSIDVGVGSYAGGLTVTLSGTGFNPAAGDNRVTVCGADCPVSGASAAGTSLSCVVPPAVAAVPLTRGAGKAVFTVAAGSDDAEEELATGVTRLAGSTGVTSCAAGVGLSFRGPESRTVGGYTCQRWDLDTPHRHGYNTPNGWTGVGRHNYCRNPDSEYGGPWCYTTDTRKRWDYCSVPKCNQADNKMDLGDPRLMQGLRFTGVAIPRGSTITTASLRLTAAYRSCGHDTAMLLRVQDTDDAPGFTGAPQDVSGRAYMAGVNATWAVADIWKWAEGSEESTDFAAVLQAVIDRPGWRYGNALALAVSHLAGDAACSAFSAEEGARAPELVVEFDPPAAATAASVDAVKQCAIEVHVTHTANGMAGLVRGDSGALSAVGEEAGAGGGDGDGDGDAAALLALVDLAAGATVSAPASMTHTAFTREMVDVRGVANSYDTYRAMCISRGGDLCPSNVVCPPAAKYNAPHPGWFEDPDARMYAPTLDGGSQRGSWVHVSRNGWGGVHACNIYRRMHGGYYGNGKSLRTDVRGLVPCCYGHGFPPAAVADGESASASASAWRSSPTAGADGRPVALTLELSGAAAASSSQVVREFSVTFLDGHFAADYTLEVSLDGTEWATALEFTHGTGLTLTHDLRSAAAPFGVSARFARVTFASPAVVSPEGGALYRVAAVRLVGHASATSVATVDAGAAAGFEYRAAVSPTVARVIAKGRSPARGTTAGNTLLTIIGTGLAASASGGNVTVSVGDLDCPVQSGSNATHVYCLTPAVGLTQGGTRRVTVTVPGVGASLPSDASTFTYADLWSSKTTWGGGDPPVGCGDFVDDRECVDSVVIPKGQVITLDVTPPRLYLILIQGTLIFDNSDAAKELELRATYLMVHGGALEVGTEDEPYHGKATITLFGHFGNVELPSFGAKVLGCYKCRLDMHGQQHPRTWTRLAATASAGATELVLQDSVSSWPVGSWVVVSPTSWNRDEAEARRVTAVSADGKTLQLGEALSFQHFAETVEVAGRALEYTAKVGLLSHNIVVQGDADAAFCGPDDVADTGTPLSCNRFGGHTFLHSPGHESLEARVSGVEFRNMGQAFRLGRYTLHYHMIGNVRRSYVRGNAFHHSWNRGLALHGINFLRVENNVAYRIHGHSFFIEDGIEHGNIIDGNLGVRTLRASSLLNTDMTPAIFWVTNPDNVITNNVAVGSDNYGFWYRPEIAATGTSTHTPEVHPVVERMGRHAGNEAHSNGRYGLRVYPDYFPTVVANFDGLRTWRNNVSGIAATAITTLKFNDVVATENVLSGFESRVINSPWGDAGVYNSLFIGRTSLPGSGAMASTGNGVWTPYRLGLEIKDTTFVNYAGAGAIEFCAHCGRGGSPSAPNGGFETRTAGLTFINCPRTRVRFRHRFEGILHDMDGSLTGLGADTYMVGASNIMPRDHCTPDATTVGGAVCSGVRPRRVIIPPVSPKEYLDGIDGTVRSEAGLDALPYIFKGAELKTGWQFTAFAFYRYTFDLNQPDVDVTDMSMDVWEMADGEYLYLTQRFEEWQVADIIGRPLYNTEITTYLGSNDQQTNITRVFGDDRVGTALVPKPDLPTGSYAFELDVDEIGGVHTMLVRACDDHDAVNVTQCNVGVRMKVRPCPKAGCWPPPPLVDQSGKEDFNRTWSNATTWVGNPSSLANPLNLIDPETGNTLVLEQEWAAEVPSEGDNVWIPRSMTVILDVSPPDLDTLIIDGTLIISDDADIELRARNIIINGGQLVAGSPTRPHTHRATITLLGDKSVAPTVVGREGHTLSSKSLIVGGNLTLYGQPRTRWTRLAATAQAGDSVITLEGGDVNWVAGDTIVIASTSFDPARAETRVVAAVTPNPAAGTTTVTLEVALRFRHFSGVETAGTRSMTMRAEVGLLSHNIVVQGDDNGDYIGGQVFVGEYSRDVWSCAKLPCTPGFVQSLTGQAQVHNVEMRQLGQFGRMNRAGVVMQTPEAGRLSSFADSSLHTVWNRGFYVPTGDGITIERTTIVDTVGSSIYIARGATNAVLRDNLVMGMKMPLTFLGVNSMVQTEPIRADFELWGSIAALHGNVAAGSERGGFAGIGIRSCGMSAAAKSAIMSNNVAHSSLFGWFSHRMALGTCSSLHDLTIYKVLNYGVFWENNQNVELTKVRIADTKVGIAMILVGPGFTQRHKLLGTMSDVMIVGASANEECRLPRISPYMCLMSKAHCKSPNAAHVGLFIPTFAGGFNTGPKIHEWTSGDSYPAIEGDAWLRGVTFSKFGMSCGRRSFMMAHNPQQPDASGPLHVAEVEVVASDVDSYIRIAPPKAGWVVLDDCVDMDCMGPKHVFVEDADGSMLGGDGGYFLPAAEYISPPAVAATVPPKQLLSDALGRPLDESEVIPNGYGLVRPGCTFNGVWNAYKCNNGLTYRRFVLANMDRDREIRSLSPVAISADGWTDLMNECQDHGWCLGYTCLKRLATYHGVMATGRRYQIHLTGSNPVKTLFLINGAAADESVVLEIYYMGGSRLNVFTGADLSEFHEDINMLDGKRKALLHKQGRIAGNNADGSWTDDTVELGDAHGTNAYNRRTKMIHIAIKGDAAVLIQQMPVVQVGMNLAVSEADFYEMEAEFISSMASLLGIPPSRIAITDVVADDGLARRRRRRRLGAPAAAAAAAPDIVMGRRTAGGVQVEFEVTPSAEINLQEDNVEVLETVGAVTVTITRSVNVLGAANFTYDTVNGTAEWGVHFTRVHGAGRFEDRETTKTLTIPVLARDVFDPASPRTFTVKVAVDADAGAVVGARGELTVSVTSVTPPVLAAPVLAAPPGPSMLSIKWDAAAWANAPEGYELQDLYLQHRDPTVTDSWEDDDGGDADGVTTTKLPLTAVSHTLQRLDTYSAHQFRLRVSTVAGAMGAWSAPTAVLRTLSVCGDNRRQGDERCDDGNANTGDGCSALCQPEAGFACTGGETGGSDVCEAGCGDGLRVGGEECDAKGESAGCVACRVVRGWSCVGGSPSSKDTCTAVCGDGVTAAGAEACDDGNTAGGDGCSATCAVETAANYTCATDEASGLSTCQSCGNGVTEGNEACDDGGAGGGCNDACSGIDAGWVCTAGSPDVCVGGPATPATPPRSTLATTDSLTFVWDAVADNGLAITSYNLQYADAASPDVWRAAPATVETRVTVPDLRASASFRARVSATTAAGTSGWSPLSDLVSTLDEEEVVTLDTEDGASSELGGLVDTLVSNAATSDYLGDLGVGGFELTPPVPPPAVPLEDDGSIESAEELEAALEAAASSNTTVEDMISESGAPVDTSSSSTAVAPVTVEKGRFTFEAAIAKMSENNAVLNVTVKRENGAFSDVTVDYATQPGTALAGVHYTTAAGTLAFAAGQLVAHFTVSTLNNDDFHTSPLKFGVLLRNPTGGAELGTLTNMTVSIQEDDAATLVEFAAATATVSETAGAVTLALQRSRATGSDMVVQVALAETGGAAAGTVFSGAAVATVTVPGAGASLTIPVVDRKSTDVDDRRFTATLTSTTNGLLGATVTVTVTVTPVDCRPRDNCVNGALCALNADCASAICTGFGRCAATATCSDLAKNGAETDVDCGGGTCDACVVSKACVVDSDCVATAECSAGKVCVARPTCDDGIKNGAETDVDCGGGTCDACVVSKACAVDSDCVATAECSADNVCVARPTCDDGIKNGAETDVDCGGVCMQTCAAGKACALHMDCADGLSCNAGVCEVVATCSDGVQGVGEADVDCGGVCTALCGQGKQCSKHAHCEQGVCSSGVCSASYRVDGSLNLVGYKTSELTPRVLALIQQGLATHLNVPKESVHVAAGGSSSSRLLSRSASDVATVSYTVYGASSAQVSAKADTMSSSSNAAALQSALQAQGLQPLSVSSSAGAVTSVGDVVDAGAGAGGLSASMKIMIAAATGVVVVAAVVAACVAKGCCRPKQRSHPVKPVSDAKPVQVSPAKSPSGKMSINPAMLARMEARGEYIANGQIVNTRTGTSTPMDPTMYNYYKSSTSSAAAATSSSSSGTPSNHRADARLKPWVRRNASSESAVRAGDVAGVIEAASAPAPTPAPAAAAALPAPSLVGGGSRRGGRSALPSLTPATSPAQVSVRPVEP